MTEVSFLTNSGFLVIGKASTSDTEKSYKFVEPWAFYGLVGKADGRIRALSVIRFESQCLE